MCNCQKKMGPPYAARYGYMSSMPDPSCPTCRVGAFAPGQPLPPMVSPKIPSRPAGQTAPPVGNPAYTDYAPETRVPHFTAADLLAHMRLEHRAFLALPDSERTRIMTQLFRDPNLVQKMKEMVTEACQLWASPPAPAGQAVSYYQNPNIAAIGYPRVPSVFYPVSPAPYPQFSYSWPQTFQYVQKLR